jgi:hypothetical protein
MTARPLLEEHHRERGRIPTRLVDLTPEQLQQLPPLPTDDWYGDTRCYYTGRDRWWRFDMEASHVWTADQVFTRTQPHWMDARQRWDAD